MRFISADGNGKLERAEWLKGMRSRAEGLYDHIAPAYWVTFGNYDNQTHLKFINQLLERLREGSNILDAGCGAGRYDGILSEPGHRVHGIDQSAQMLARARERFPQQQYPRLSFARIGLQEMDFLSEFDAAICLDAMEHICPEDWFLILTRIQRALKLGGWFYVTVEEPDWDEVRESYERAKAQGLPVAYGEVVDPSDTAYERVLSLDWQAINGENMDGSVYHFYPQPDQVRDWFTEAGFTIEEEGSGQWYTHYLARNVSR